LIYKHIYILLCVFHINLYLHITRWCQYVIMIFMVTSLLIYVIFYISEWGLKLIWSKFCFIIFCVFFNCKQKCVSLSLIGSYWKSFKTGWNNFPQTAAHCSFYPRLVLSECVWDWVIINYSVCPWWWRNMSPWDSLTWSSEE